LATIFGSGLAASTATAALNSGGQLPTRLAGAAVQVNGKDSPLLYVSPQQINFLVPDGTTPGVAELVVLRGGDSGSLTATVQVSDAAPGLFDGAVVNAVTQARSPFLVETPENAGDDKRTRLAVYGTGIRRAGRVTAEARDGANRAFSLAVEFAGAVPGFFGLDQVNLVVPPEMDAAGAVSLTITADSAISNSMAFQMNPLPPGSVRLTAFTIHPDALLAGEAATGTLALNAPAPAAGVFVSLQPGSSIVLLPLGVTIPAGAVSADFPIRTSTVATVQSVSITARAGLTTLTAALEVDPPTSAQLQALTLGPAAVAGGDPVNVTATLSSVAVTAAKVALTSDSASVKAPDSVTIPVGQSSATVAIPTTPVSAVEVANLTATFGRTTRSASVSLNPPLTLSLPSGPVTGGTTLAGNVVLFSDPPPVGVTVMLSSSDPSSAQVIPSVFIPAGQRSAQISVTTSPVTSTRTVTISATYQGAGIVQKSAVTLTAPGAPTLVDFTLNPSAVTAGGTISGTVSVAPAAPITGLPVGLTSSAVLGLPIPPPAVPAGATAVTFPITTTQFTTKGQISITATAGGVSKTVTLTVH
jgi:uncharacterized protein (TIGR03437 family)